MPKKKNTRKKPLVVEVLLACDGIGREPSSSKTTLYGVFDSFTPTEFPAQVGFFAYVKLTGSGGPHGVTVDLVDAKDKSVLAEPPTAKVEFPEKDKKALIVVRFEGVRVKKPGIHFLVVRLDGHILDHRYQLSAQIRHK